MENGKSPWKSPPLLLQMDALFENIKLYCGILRKCSLPEVDRWEEEDLDRAIHWADYFDKALVRISKRQSVVAKVDQKLKELGQSNGWRIGAMELNYDTFQQSSDYLSKALVGNPRLPQQLKEKVLSRLKDKRHAEPPRKLLCEEATTSEANGARKVVPPEDNQLQTLPCDSISLLKCLQMNGTLSSLCKQLDVLSTMDGATNLILQSLIEDESSYTTTKTSILHWLVEKMKSSNCTPQYIYLWDHPADLLAKISSQYLEFFKEHIKYLANETEKLETVDVRTIDTIPNPTELDTSQVTVRGAAKSHTTMNLDSYASSLDKVVSHFVALVQTNQEVKEVCLLLVRSRALRHCTRGRSRFSYCAPIATCAWSNILSRISQTVS